MSRNGQPAPRRRRGDAEVNASRILEAAVDLLGRAGDPSMAEIADVADVSRQTLYAHFASREMLYQAVRTSLTGRVAEALTSASAEGDVRDALANWVDTAWVLLDRYPALLNPALFTQTSGADVEAHGPVVVALRGLLDRGRRENRLHPDVSTPWLLAAILSLGHAAAGEVVAGRMTSARAGAAFREGVLRLCLRP
ncbi:MULTISPECIES: TetR/AcrR family transcriptional regulator [unclassified Pseudofrankia]|uniref:TetR/AcrR family transcriptional regulator n=1 Tax=unclassified Pseudofrankia TaxID=2994372 RepID=UPI0012FFBB40|nr:MULTISPECIES: TetR/AcrR family transcriptional regulator [unclassified Pseudofrankia]MDT3441021.1 TetR/AcrR family transcriptional regulator [Pseudofrankia sp. BMG5.37]